MKKFLFIFALGLSFSLNSHALTIDLVPAASQISAGNTVQIDAKISGLKTSGATSLGVYDVNVNFDSSRFAFNSINWGDSVKGNQLDLNHFGSLQISDSSNSGWINLFELSFDDVWSLENLQANSFILFSLVFSSIAPGTGVFHLDANALGDAYGNNLALTSTTDARVTVKAASVPEPATNMLMLIGLIALGLARVKPSDK
ncbi:hypothetical protein GCM10011613_26790 [Cellvibrio zantedeschiae]|uniref:PEP-CTERM protein-sorting domain-containing protein n=1 Tax=Cellvibrio zantedeschiae TaxID=1237077 RepID=A0ABQ3BA15_9GAMM|nr:PEP-CTERM sorting domain-containing protein [Cellvibrio zantedeschiae]GGY80406.1 hypothetical protein GCM10011613_26790 [Cellvibrio zantedeschiae]